MATTAVLVDAAAAYLLLADPLSRAVPAACLHVAAALLMAAGMLTWARSRGREVAQSWALLGGLLTLMQPVAGGLGAVLLFSCRPRTRGEGAVEECARIPPTPPRDEQTLEERVRSLVRLDESSDDDGLSGDLAHLRDLVESLPELGDPQRVRQLKGLTLDPRLDAYHIATARLARLQEYFTARMYDARQRIQESPASEQAHAVAGQCYVDYLSSGLVDPALEDYYCKLAAERFGEALRLAPQRRDLYLRCADLYLRLGRFSEALAWCRAALDQDPEDPDAVAKRVEVLFEASRGGALEAVQALCQAVSELRASCAPARVDVWWLTAPGEGGGACHG